MATPGAMNIQTARAEIQVMVRDTDFPTLLSTEVDLLVRKSKRQDVNRNPPDSFLAWQAGTAYHIGDTVVPEPRNDCYYTCTVAGTSGATALAWPSGTGSTVTDGTVSWQRSGAALWTPTWNLAYGIWTGWRIKMGKVAGAYDIQTGGQKLNRSQLFKMCQEMVREWGKRASTFAQLELQGSLRDRRLFQNQTNQSDELFIDGQIWWPGILGSLGGAVPDYEIPRGYTGVSAGGQWIDP